MAWDLCLSGPALVKAGAHADPVMIAYVPDSFSDAAEGKLCTDINLNITGIQAKSTIVQQAVKDACEALIAMDIATYNPVGYSAREWDGIMNKNDERYTEALRVLGKKENLKI